MAKTTIKKPAPKKTVDDLVSEIEKRKGGSNASAGSQEAVQRKSAVTAVPTADEKERMLAELAERFGVTPAQVEAMLKVQDEKALAARDAAAKPDQKHVAPSFKAGDPTVPVKLKSDYWLYDHSHEIWPIPPALDAEGKVVPNTGDNRAKAGTKIDLPVPEARRLLDAGKAERADPLPGEA